jgi:hypothetical protein
MADGKTQDAETLKKELETLQLQTQIAEGKKKLAAAIQPDAPPSKDPQLDAAKRAADLAEQSKRLRDALPTPETKALEGTTTIDDKVLIESYMLSYEALGGIAGSIKAGVSAANPAPRTIFIFSEKDVASLRELRAFLSQIELIGRAFENAKPPQVHKTVLASVIGVGAVAVTAVKTLIDLIALFRTDTEIKGVETTLDDVALVAMVAHQLEGIEVFDPQIMPLGITSSSFSSSTVVQELEGLYSKRQDAQKAVADAIAVLDTTIPDPEARKAQAAALMEPLTKAEAFFQTFHDALLKVDETSGTSELARLLWVEELAAKLRGRDCYVLYLKIVKAGGSNRVTRNLFTGSKLSHSGGAIVTYLLFRADGSIAASETLHEYSGYRLFKEID